VTYDGVDMTRVMWGEHARHVPAWLVVQDAGPGTVALIGSSMTPGQEHPLRYGAPGYRDTDDPFDETYVPHHLVIGEIIVRPHVVIATRALTGYGAGQFLTDLPALPGLIENGQGQLIIGDTARLAEITHRARTGAWRT
jgi:hypothetical protein